MHAGHDKHLCKIWTDTLDVDELKEFVKNPSFICQSCGRVANKAENLCQPTEI